MALNVDDECGSGRKTSCSFSALQLSKLREDSSPVNKHQNEGKGMAKTQGGDTPLAESRATEEVNPCWRSPWLSGCQYYRRRQGPFMVLYHQTGPEQGQAILKTGFRLGSRGWCGGGIYFATSPQGTVTKAVGANSHTGFMIEARVSLGKVLNMDRTCFTGMTSQKIHSLTFDTIKFNPGDGDEYVIYDTTQVMSTRQIAWLH